jgi:hypothetical protein
LPSVLMSLMHPQPAPVLELPPAPPRPTVAKTKAKESYSNKGGALKARILGLMSDKQERRSNIIVKELKAKAPTSVYTILTSLVQEGHLIRTRYAHYRLKLRNSK